QKISRFETKTGRGFRLVDEDGNSVFLKRNHEGLLAADGVDTDGKMMAVVRGKEGIHIFAADAGSLQLSSGLRLKFSRPVLLMLDVHERTADLKVDVLDGATELHLSGVSEGSVKMDETTTSNQRAISLSRGEREIHLSWHITEKRRDK
ncbi:MAG TPA: hypothetical protein VFE38_13615, partial [Edaphobacter sp.]|nr:hypothetical protein [Edaphobacter sp.]